MIIHLFLLSCFGFNLADALTFQDLTCNEDWDTHILSKGMVSYFRSPNFPVGLSSLELKNCNAQFKAVIILFYNFIMEFWRFFWAPKQLICPPDPYPDMSRGEGRTYKNGLKRGN